MRSWVRWREAWMEAQGRHWMWDDGELPRCSRCGWLFFRLDNDPAVFLLNDAGDGLDRMCLHHRDLLGVTVVNCSTGMETTMLPERSQLRVLAHEVWCWARSFVRLPALAARNFAVTAWAFVFHHRAYCNWRAFMRGDWTVLDPGPQKPDIEFARRK